MYDVHCQEERGTLYESSVPHLISLISYIAETKCDKKTPSCCQCIKSALVCQGYTRGYVWVSANRDRLQSSRPHNYSKDTGYEGAQQGPTVVRLVT